MCLTMATVDKAFVITMAAEFKGHLSSPHAHWDNISVLSCRGPSHSTLEIHIIISSRSKCLRFVICSHSRRFQFSATQFWIHKSTVHTQSFTSYTFNSGCSDHPFTSSSSSRDFTSINNIGSWAKFCFPLQFGIRGHRREPDTEKKKERGRGRANQ